MADLQGGIHNQPTTCPGGWFPGAIVVRLDLTCRQEGYSRRCVVTVRFVYNRMVANDQASRDLGPWLAFQELEKDLNNLKHIDPCSGLPDPDEQVRGHEACRNYRNAHSSWRCEQSTVPTPVFHSKSRTGAGSLMTIPGVHRVGYDSHRRTRPPYLGSMRVTRSLPEGIPHQVTLRKRNSRRYARVVCRKPLIQGSPRRGTSIVKEPQLPARLDHGASTAEPGSSPRRVSLGLWKIQSAGMP